MKRNIHQRCFFVLLLFMVFSFTVNAQCPAGTTRDTLNWDYLDFLPYSGTYISPTAFITLAQSQTQRFTFGTQKVTITHNYTNNSIGGDVNTHTAETGTYGKGDDIRFRNNGTVTFTFQNAVQNIKFSISDIDRSQTVNVSALNGASGTNVALSTLSGTILTVSNNNTPSATVVASSVVVANTDNTPLANGTVNVDVAGPVTSFTLTVTTTGTTASEDGSLYVSDISACSAGTFPLNYYHISKPFTGQPSYFLAVMDNTVFYVNVNNGVVRRLFRDPGHTNFNSLAYDPYRHMVYYSYSLTGSPQSDRTIKRYDYDLDTFGVFIPNVNAHGIPTYESGVESGAAAFYNGSYYLGIEGSDMNGANSSRESIVWKVDLTPTYAATGLAQQVYAVPVDDGAGNALHDWSDIGINDGIMYDFDGAGGETDFYHKDLLTGSCININPSPGSLVPRQVSVDWQGQMYNSGSPSSISSGTVAPYNGNGTVNTAQQYTMRYQGVAIAGSWGDAGEAFKPKTDFGDAPASYDPAGSDPGTHEKNDSIYLGPLKPGIEWNKKTSVDATGDGSEEDGVAGLQVISTGVSNFTVPVKVFNNTGRNATLVGWVDADGDGIYETAEATSLIIASNAAIQNVTLLWTGINTTVPAFGTTFMRLRITTADQGMTTAKPTGYFDNGEIEDYTVAVSLLLPDQSIILKAQRMVSNKVNLLWELNYENNNRAYELQRSKDGISWQTITNVVTSGGNHSATYSYADADPEMPVSYYRVKVLKNAGATMYSDVRKIDFKKASSISIAPNPAKSNTVLTIQSSTTGKAQVNILDFTGRSVFELPVAIINGTNELDLEVVQKLSDGVYKVRVQINDEILVTSLVIRK